MCLCAGAELYQTSYLYTYTHGSMTMSHSWAAWPARNVYSVQLQSREDRLFSHLNFLVLYILDSRRPLTMPLTSASPITLGLTKIMN